jgi:2'-hydroxyisoflavone reductase
MDMNLLIIGGTSFLGRAAAVEALRRGDKVTTLNRGQSAPDVEGVEALRGDRDDDAALAQLAGRTFDGVIDTCGFVPRVVGKAVRALADTAGHYAFVSSISASGTWPQEVARDDDVGPPCASDAGPDDGDYGVLKAGCERAVSEVFGERSTIARAGLILGPHENVGRLTWWLSRMARGGEVLAPGDPDRPMQLIDARDLATYLLDSIDRGTHGTYNVSAPPGNATMGSWLADAATVTDADAGLTWVDDEFLLAREVESWTELPLWMPPGQGGDGAWAADTSGAARTGLVCRPVSETVRDTWAWMQDENITPDVSDGRFGTGLSGPNGIEAAKEQRILAEWHAR